MTKLRILPLVLAVILVAAACGRDASESSDSGDNASGDAPSTEDQLLERLSEEEDDPLFGLMTASEASCFVKAMISNDALLEAAMSDDDDGLDNLPPDLQQSLMNNVFDCAPDAVATMMAQGMQEDSDLTDDDALCLAEGLVANVEVLKAMFTMGDTDEEPPTAILMLFFEILEECDIPMSTLG